MLSKTLLLLGISLFHECPDSICTDNEQVAVVQVHLARTVGDLNKDKVYSEVFRYRQFSWTLNGEDRVQAKSSVTRQRANEEWPEQYKKYRLPVVLAITKGPGDYTHYRRMDYGVQYSWSCAEWHTEVNWNHGFCRAENVVSFGTHDEEDDKIKRARMKAWWVDKKKRDEVNGC